VRLVSDYTRGGDAGAASRDLLATVHPKPEVVGVGSSIDLFGGEDHALALAKGAEKGPFERARPEENFAAVVISNDDSGTGSRVVRLDHTLHR
jgi:hypothetical protein